ncbi:MAG: hypothetical protein AABZ15_15655 [Nitrospirota bacterium]
MPREKKGRVDTTLCHNFCQYYKPGKNEELACQGYVVVHRLIEKGRHVSQDKPRRTAALDARTIEGLKGRVCAACSFRAADCDFILSGGTASPCGGYVLLFHLLGSGDLTLEELEER